jgi:hypothetical protein
MPHPGWAVPEAARLTGESATMVTIAEMSKYMLSANSSFSGPRRVEDIPEAEIHPAQMREGARNGRAHRRWGRHQSAPATRAAVPPQQGD